MDDSLQPDDLLLQPLTDLLAETLFQQGQAIVLGADIVTLRMLGYLEEHPVSELRVGSDWARVSSELKVEEEEGELVEELEEGCPVEEGEGGVFRGVQQTHHHFKAFEVHLF